MMTNQVPSPNRQLPKWLRSATSVTAETLGDIRLSKENLGVKMKNIIRRNRPCPCGSGKKFKKCCIDNILYRNKHWTKEEVGWDSVDKIISNLKLLGVTISEKDFRKGCKSFYSAEDLSERWFEKYGLELSNYNEDYLWLAAWVLWGKLDNLDHDCDEIIGEEIEEGFRLFDFNQSMACKIWSDAWEQLIIRYEDVRAIGDFENFFKGDVDLDYWCQIFDNGLDNCGSAVKSYAEYRIKFCSTFLERFELSSEDIIKRMKRALCESYFLIGQKKKGDECFKKLIKEYPRWVWGYIGWSDMYRPFALDSKTDEEIAFAKKILEEGLEKAESEDDKNYIYERLDDLE